MDDVGSPREGIAHVEELRLEAEKTGI